MSIHHGRLIDLRDAMNASRSLALHGAFMYCIGKLCTLFLLPPRGYNGRAIHSESWTSKVHAKDASSECTTYLKHAKSSNLPVRYFCLLQRAGACCFPEVLLHPLPPQMLTSSMKENSDLRISTGSENVKRFSDFPTRIDHQ